jgi:hypothetical protein
MTSHAFKAIKRGYKYQPPKDPPYEPTVMGDRYGEVPCRCKRWLYDGRHAAKCPRGILIQKEMERARKR